MRECKKWVGLREFHKWKLYYEVEPFGEQRADLRAAMIICCLSNTLGNLKKVLQVADVLPFLDESESHSTESPEDARYRRGCALERKMREYTAEHNLKFEADEAKGRVG